ncbi:ABC-three component system middle component 1 [Flavobacterium beibuense]|uniref:Uncharacterized protein n=1 Tax=Flavobacterium beibuense TaxID=657326 RepID=A0A444WEP1_9FLAO|nr:ABC-three component system middle component 1 [Flavobacterium beibuense]RYJ44279.1 hypothetical protein NU09_0889 [Flavobacterium beibuense]
MQLNKSDEIIKKLSQYDEFFQTSGTELWQAPSANINLNLFSKIYEKNEDLKNNYIELRDHVAVSFQGRMLDKSVERWNLYLLYLVREEVPEELKQQIIQDKFSSRKMVYNIGQDEVSKDYIEKLVAKTLIDIEIPQRDTTTDKLYELIKLNHPRVENAISQIGMMNNRDNLPTLINLLSHD